ncbi:glycosyltransferase family 9 protein [bacterium]|nr:glycosyltransferase family 9 protein [bacterium]
MTPLIRWLKQAFPGSNIDIVVKKQYAPLLETNPRLHRIIAWEPASALSLLRQVRPWSYDVVIDLQGNTRSGLLMLFRGKAAGARFRHMRLRRLLLVKTGLNLYGRTVPVPLRFLDSVRKWRVADDGKGLELFIDPRAAETTRSLLEEAGLTARTPYVVLAPGAGRATKRWPGDRYAEAARRLITGGYRVVLTGGREDRDLCRGIAEKTDSDRIADFSGRCSLPETAALLEGAALLITNDTGVMHMGCALGTPVTAVFGPTSRELGFYPFRAVSTVVERPLSCRPCSFHGTETCPRTHFDCMKTIGTDDVLAASEPLMNRK